MANAKKKSKTLTKVIFENDSACKTIVYVYKGDRITKFVQFENVIGFYVILRTGYYGHRNLYSKISFDIELMPECGIIKFNYHKLGYGIYGFKSWASIANHLKTNIDFAKHIIMKEFPEEYGKQLQFLPDLVGTFTR